MLRVESLYGYDRFFAFMQNSLRTFAFMQKLTTFCHFMQKYGVNTAYALTRLLIDFLHKYKRAYCVR